MKQPILLPNSSNQVHVVAFTATDTTEIDIAVHVVIGWQCEYAAERQLTDIVPICLDDIGDVWCYQQIIEDVPQWVFPYIASFSTEDAALEYARELLVAAQARREATAKK